MNRAQRRAQKSKKKSKYTGLTKVNNGSTFGSKVPNT